MSTSKRESSIQLAIVVNEEGHTPTRPPIPPTGSPRLPGKEGARHHARVFFYHDGVNNGTRLGVPPQDDRNLQKLWSELGEQYKLDLVVCVAAAQRRGILDGTKPSATARTPAISRRASASPVLGSSSKSRILADRTVVFGD